jgi:hypothetical protein
VEPTKWGGGNGHTGILAIHQAEEDMREMAGKKLIKRFSKLTTPVVIAVALAFVLSPSVGLANTPPK